jgi:hypothetical protein
MEKKGIEGGGRIGGIEGWMGWRVAFVLFG